MNEVESYHRKSIKTMISERFNYWDSLCHAASSMELIDDSLFQKYCHEYDKWWAYIEQLCLIDSIMEQNAWGTLSAIDCSLWRERWGNVYSAEKAFLGLVEKQIYVDTPFISN